MADLDPVEEIKRRLNLIEVIGNYLPLKKAGRTFKALCPFHAEKKPSFTVSPDKQVWHCFGCGAGGDLFSFVMKKEGINFAEALEMLAERAGVRLERRIESSGLKQKILKANELTALYFQEKLNSPEGKKARDYLEGRGLTASTIKQFRLGYAPREGLLAKLAAAGQQEKELPDFGLAVEREGRLIDKFRERLIFPLADHLGRVVAFTGRSLNEEEPKYLNSPETLLFVKSQMLYGLDLAKEEIQKRDFAVLVEGQFDLLSSYQSGVTNVVAVSGTAFTAEQARLLKRYTGNLIFAFDNDEAGREAVKRSLPLASQEGFKIKVASLSDKDPASVIQKNPSLWAEALKGAKSAVEFFLAEARKEFGEDNALAKQRLAEAVEEIIALLFDPVEREIYISQMARELSVGELSLKEAVKRRLEKTSSPTPPLSPSPQGQSALPFLENKLLALLFAFPENLSLFLPELERIEFVNPLCRHIYSQLSSSYTGDTEEPFSAALFLERLPENARVHLAEQILMVEEEYSPLDPEEIRGEITFYLRLLKDQKSRLKRQELIEQIAQAEGRGDIILLQELLEKLREG